MVQCAINDSVIKRDRYWNGESCEKISILFHQAPERHRPSPSRQKLEGTIEGIELLAIYYFIYLQEQRLKERCLIWKGFERGSGAVIRLIDLYLYKLFKIVMQHTMFSSLNLFWYIVKHSASL